jgi:tubulin polyglutamylase TTLL5
MVFRPYVEPMTTPPMPPPDKGYYYVMYNSDVKLIRYILEDNGFCRLPQRREDWSIMWHGGPPKPAIYQSMTRYQKINHMPKTFEITRKDQMFKNISRMALTHGKKSFDFVPQTYILPQEAYELANEMKGDTWIVKPSASS